MLAYTLPRPPPSEGAKRKRQPDSPAADAPPALTGRLAGRLGARAPGADRALAEAAAQPAGGAGAGSAERPSKVPRSSSGFSVGQAEKGEAPAPEDVPAAGEPATRALRIDGFVRPFHERQVWGCWWWCRGRWGLCCAVLCCAVLCCAVL